MPIMARGLTFGERPLTSFVEALGSQLGHIIPETRGVWGALLGLLVDGFDRGISNINGARHRSH